MHMQMDKLLSPHREDQSIVSTGASEVHNFPQGGHQDHLMLLCYLQPYYLCSSLSIGPQHLCHYKMKYFAIILSICLKQTNLYGTQKTPLPRASGYSTKDIGSVVVLRAQVISSSISSLVEKEGAIDLLYLRHLSMHSDHSAACVLNIILFILGLHAIYKAFQMDPNEKTFQSADLLQSSNSFSAIPLDTCPDTFHFISFQLNC